MSQQATSIQIREANFPHDLALVRELFEEYAAGVGVDLCFQNWSAELAGLPGKYVPPGGGLWLAEQGGVAGGCIAFRPLDAGRAEMKRLYVRQKFRGLGLGRLLAMQAVNAAAAAGYRKICLDTLPTMTSAAALYRSLGFVEIEPYYQSPIAGTLFMARDLG